MLMDMDATRNRLDKRLRVIKTRKHLGDGLVGLIEQVAHMQLAARQEVSVELPGAEALATSVEIHQGKPLLPLHSFPVDRKHAGRLFNELLAILAKQHGSLARAASVISASVAKTELNLDELFTRFLEGDRAFFETWGEEFPETPRVLDFLAQAALTPGLEAAAEALAGHLPGDGARTTGACPVCGSLPFISAIRDKEGKRFAACSMCRHEYRIRRLACPYCDEDDQEKLKFFTAREEPGYRVDTCDTCGLYVKTVDFREMDRHEVPALDDLDSLALDFVAEQQGYRRATLSAWGF